MQLGSPIQVAVQSHPDTPAVHDGQETLSYRALFEQARVCAQVVGRQYPQPGTSIALHARPGLDFVILLHGCWLAGLVPELHADTGLTLQALESSNLQQADPCYRWGPTDDFATVFTSGSTGTPRTCTLNYGHFLLQALGSAAKVGTVPGDRWLNPLPPHTIGSLAIVVRCCLLGLTVDLAQPFRATEVQQRLASGDVQLASMVPVMLDQVLDHAPDTVYPPQLRAVLCGGAALPADTADRAHKQGIATVSTWGMSESGAMITARTTQDKVAGASCGYPLPFVELQTATQGHLQFRMPWQQDWQDTSDLGYLEDNGAVQVTGRADDTILSGAQNLDPLEIESALLQHAQMQSCVVFAVPDASWGQRPWALAVLAPTKNPATETEIQQWLGRRLPRRKVPDRIIFVTKIPHTEAGKISRRQIARMWHQEKSTCEA